MIDVREYVDSAGTSPFSKWLRDLDVQAAAKVATALERIADENLSNIQPVGAGVLEFRIDFGPGYRVYLGRDGDRLVILLAGGTKKRQRTTLRRRRRAGPITGSASHEDTAMPLTRDFRENDSRPRPSRTALSRGAAPRSDRTLAGRR